MGRGKTPELRTDLLERATTYVLEHGLVGLSLRPLADALGTNARMLVYHFGSKEALVTAILEQATAQQQDALRALLTTTASRSIATSLQAFWQHLTHPDSRPLLRLLLEVDVLGLHEPVYAAFSARAFSSWRALLTQSLRVNRDFSDATALATLIVGVVSGLLLDLVVTDDLTRVNAAFEVFAIVLQQAVLQETSPEETLPEEPVLQKEEHP